MTGTPRFHSLTITRVASEAAGSVALAFAIPPELREAYSFTPGQYLTLRASIEGQDVRRSYSICSTPRHLASRSELIVGIRPMQGGVFSNWAATQLKAGDALQVMTPQGRFVSTKPRALHRVGFAAGSGITPILSIMASTMEDQPESKFTLIYGNRSMANVMFNEALQDLKDRYPGRLTLIHILSRQAQESDLLQGRIDEPKIQALIKALLPVQSMDEVFVCGPEAMIEAAERALLEAGVPDNRIHTERFTSPSLEQLSSVDRQAVIASHNREGATGDVSLKVLLDGKQHELNMTADQLVLDVALAAGLDLPYSCKGGVCSTCRVKVMDGTVEMEKNFGLEKWETEQGFVLSCQAHPTSKNLTVSFDER